MQVVNFIINLYAEIIKNIRKRERYSPGNIPYNNNSFTTPFLYTCQYWPLLKISRDAELLLITSSLKHKKFMIKNILLPLLRLVRNALDQKFCLMQKKFNY